MLPAKKFWRSKRFQEKYGRIAGYLILTAMSCIFIIPFLWSLSASFKNLQQVYAVPHQWIPSPVRWNNYVMIFKLLPLVKFFTNTIYITLLSLVGQIASAAVVAYAFARLRWFGRDFFFIVLLSTIMLPAQVTLIPQFLLFKYLGWHDTYNPLIVPYFLGGGVFNIFLLRQFFKTIPLELENAAKIDGCSHLRIFLIIMLPLAKPALATVTVLSFIRHWNDFLQPLIYLQTFDKFPLSLGINMFKDVYSDLPHYVMATSMLSLIPVLILFFMAQKYFVRGIILSGIKG
ncbi:carbohydrate ABC transporter permease [candidate division KSB1 bacterium]|nr:carbohydrate ABC transporter permease [candidate division KSB1 bacterium]